MSQILFLLFFYFLILYSILGYGRIFTLINSNYQASSFDGLLGIIILILISYLTNFFSPHNFLHNSILLSFGLLLFIYDLKKNFSKRIIDLKVLSLIFLIIFIGLLMYKNHDDFYYYHFPYTIILTNFEKVFGLGNLNHGFRTHSSIFYLNSLFYLPGIKYFLLNGGAAYILGFSNFIIYKNIKDLIQKNKINIVFYLSLFSLIYINTTFARLAEHGTDRSALILIFLMSIYYLKSLDFNNKKIDFSHLKNYYSKLLILFALIISLKAFYLIYTIIFLFWLIQMKKNLNLKILINLFLKNYYSYIIILIFGFTLFTTFSNTGCLIYPAKITCFENFSWSIPLQQVEQMHLWYEQWSKGGAGPNFRVENPEFYVQNLNWFNNWIDVYFFNKVSDNILLISVIFLVVIFIISYKAKIQNFNNQDYKLFYFLIIFLFIEWFYNHPSLRYGGYTLLALLFFVPLSNFLCRYKIKKSILIRKVNLIFLITVLIFIGRNLVRIDKEIDQYGYNPIVNAFFYLNKNGFVLNEEVKKRYKIWKVENKKFLVITE